MNSVVALEFRFYITPDGRVWSPTIFGYTFWQRYLEVFDRVTVAASAVEVDSVTEGWNRADGNGVRFFPLPNASGVLQGVLNSRTFKRNATHLAGSNDAVILRVPTVIAQYMFPLLKKSGKPFGLEVTTDPWGFYSPGSTKNPLRPLIRRYSSLQLKRQCESAFATAYVTGEALQKRYPAGGLSIHYSSIELSQSDITVKSRPKENFDKDTFRIIFTGGLDNYVKSPDILLKAVSICLDKGRKIQLNIIGDGKKRKAVEDMANNPPLSGNIRFLGNLSSGKAVFDELDRSDLFILPSRTETIPRAMVEAMARGLPCIGSTVGGIPELLAPEDLVPVNDENALARKIIEVTGSPSRMERMSERNRETALRYCDEVLNKKRIEFYTWIKDATEMWLKKSSNSI